MEMATGVDGEGLQCGLVGRGSPSVDIHGRVILQCRENFVV